ncbi:MAG: hypothetical protein A2167_01375 [Planctomycetes bacterium RBG_13_46_10]|nr:MAG: hypothetical protein A2167_01375 [Planctomycetes bacterium RBG_13_46_10]
MNNKQLNILYTIGHSNHKIENFLSLLKTHSINCIVDVRSTPYSHYNTQFNREFLVKELRNANIEYIYLGNQLGARSSDTHHYNGNTVNFEYLAKTEQFHIGLENLKDISSKYKSALMCAEKDPIECHRFILICRNLKNSGIHIKHILSDGSIENNIDTERRLVKMLKIEPTLFESSKTQDEITDQAYEQQASNIAYDSSTQEEIHHVGTH